MLTPIIWLTLMRKAAAMPVLPCIFCFLSPPTATLDAVSNTLSNPSGVFRVFSYSLGSPHRSNREAPLKPHQGLWPAWDFPHRPHVLFQLHSQLNMFFFGILPATPVVQSQGCKHPCMLFTDPTERTWRTQQRSFGHFIIQAVLCRGRQDYNGGLYCFYKQREYMS